jgi:hypothetical protein
MIGDGRAPGAPPVDSLAEAVVLLQLMNHPERIGGLDMEPLLVFPEHREIWQVLVRTYMRGPYADDRDRNTALFGLAFDGELQRAHPRDWRNYLDLLYSANTTASQRAWEDATERPQHEPGMLRLSEYHHGFDWWLMRLQRIAEARRGIQAAQELAEAFYRAPDHVFTAQDAHALLRQRMPVRDTDIGMEVPV